MRAVVEHGRSEVCAVGGGTPRQGVATLEWAAKSLPWTRKGCHTPANFWQRPTACATSLNMFPASAIQNMLNVNHTDTVSFSKLPVIFGPFHMLFSYFNHIFRCQFCPPVSFSVGHSMFPCGVLGVGFRSANEQVTGANAGWIVALMKNVKSIWNFSVFKNPRDSMGFVQSAPEPKHAISMFICAANPVPAFRIWESYYFSPKSVINSSNTRACLEFEFWTNPVNQFRFLLHKSVRLICATSRAVLAAPGHFSRLTNLAGKSTMISDRLRPQPV